jgi:hypothetical protein
MYGLQYIIELLCYLLAAPLGRRRGHIISGSRSTMGFPANYGSPFLDGLDKKLRTMLGQICLTLQH